MSLSQASKSDMPYQVRSLYRSLLRQGNQFAAYNFREYAKRRTRDSFREHQKETDDRRIQELVQAGLKDLQMLKRQTVISQFFQLDRLVVESGKTGKQKGDAGGIVRQKDQGQAAVTFPTFGYADNTIDGTEHVRVYWLGLDSWYPELRSLLDAAHGQATSPHAPAFTTRRDFPPTENTIASPPPDLRTPANRGSRLRYFYLLPAIVMAPFRNRDRSNRSGRGQVEHNVLEGLPINQYREVEITIGPTSTENQWVDKDAWPELPMPRDSHLLPEYSQRVLRTTRRGQTYKPPAPPEEDKDGPDEEDEPKEVPQGFMVKKWVKVPRHLEDTEPEYLAKRRKGLPSQYVTHSQLSAQPAGLRETKVKKTDAEGNVSVYKVLVPEGQAVEGEIQATDTVVEAAPVAAAPGTVVEGVGVVNAEGVVVAKDIMQQTPPRRKHPPKKKKRKGGPGRGKKKVVFAEGAPEQGTPASGAESGTLAVPGAKQQEGSVEPSEGGDTPMPDAGDEEEGSGEEGSDDEEREEGTHSPTPAGSVPPAEILAAPASAPAVDSPKEIVMEEVPLVEAAVVPEPSASAPSEPTTLRAIDTTASVQASSEHEKEEKTGRDPSSSPELPLSAMAHSRQNSLNQISTLPTVEAPVPAPASEPEPEPEPVPVQVEEPAPIVESVPTPEPVLALAPAPKLVSAPEPISAPELVPEPEPLSAPEPVSAPEAVSAPELVPAPEPVSSPEFAPALEAAPAPEAAPTPEPVPTAESVPAAEPVPAPTLEQSPITEQTMAEEAPASDGEPDLLGSLERQLDKESESMAAPNQA
ncbi:hypothetical protein K458DRAFT_482542 [Lentithecium fluviatile CBS 122367]|uniref:Complex 1 LYR protein domain-containing protein n=1 Tax=Lentithecium fluviatile CBS 122367 TaxID=1168545 RepID=A0A6G1JNQ7_9PLEO|nr:hypothetical protein K458DRAFT_482542 [Lentithecium fluviatile CBS 122367]